MTGMRDRPVQVLTEGQDRAGTDRGTGRDRADTARSHLM